MRLTFLFLLITNLCYAQSSFYVGAQGSVNITTLLNKEDKNAPDGMLKKKSGLQPGYGLQLGYKYKHFRLSMEPNYLQYKVSYSGQSDTANIRSFDATARFKYYQIPLVLSYGYSFNKNLSLHVGIGASFNYLSYYKEEFEGRVAIAGVPNQLYTSSYFNQGLTGHSELKEISYANAEIKYEQPKYKFLNQSILFNLMAEYNLKNKLAIFVKFQFSKGIKDIENKGVSTETVKEVGGATYSNSINYWNETNYLRYYQRYPEKYNQRPATYTMALGVGLGLTYDLSQNERTSERQTWH